MMKQSRHRNENGDGTLVSYPDFNQDFDKIINKYEFQSNASDKKKGFVYQEPHQLLLANYISKPTIYENILLYHGLGTGKCMKKDTKILMFDGTIKNIQDIEIGELLMGDDSTPRQVLSLARGTDDMYIVKGDSLSEYYTVNQEHILCFLDKSKGVVEIPVKDYILLPTHEKATLKGYRVSIEFPAVELVNDPYTYGFQYTFQDPLDRVYKCNSYDVRTRVLAGILDSSATTCGESYYLDKRGKQYTDDVIYLARSLGSCISFDDNVLVIHRAQCAQSCYDVTVEHVERDEYYGFTISGNGRYVLGDFTVTHNTCASISIAEGFKEYVNNMGKKIVVLVKNKSIQRNFLNELVSKCTGDEYLTEEQRQFVNGNKAGYKEVQKNMLSKIVKEITKTYKFITYGTFVNQVLGAKDYQKDKFGNRTIQKVVNGKIVRKRITNELIDFSNTVIIVDEAHNVTNNDAYVALKTMLDRSYNYRLVLLTATPMYDNPKEIFELSNLLNISDTTNQLPTGKNLLTPIAYVTNTKSAFITNSLLRGGIVTVTEIGLDALRKSLYGKVSYIQPNTKTNPTKIEVGDDLVQDLEGTCKVVYCNMSRYQYTTYKNALKLDVNYSSKYDLSSAISNLEADENITEKPTAESRTGSLYKNSSDASTMSYPNNLFGKDGFLSVFTKTKGGYTIQKEYESIVTSDLQNYSAKLAKLLDNLENSPGIAFIYSNYVTMGGTTLIKLVLLANGYTEFKGVSTVNTKGSFFMFDDNTSIETREKYRKIFNSPANKDGRLIKIIVGSPIISEGITLKNVRQVHILEPAWNMSRINQIIGRAVRNRSHQDLPVESQNVEIYKYVSVHLSKTLQQTNNFLDTFFVDREKYILSEQKDRANKHVERLLKEVAFDCTLMKDRNRKNPSLNNTAECDYQGCDFNCVISNQFQHVDKSTYNLHINVFDKYDIHFVTNTLRELFQTHFVWSLEDLVTYIRNIEPNVSLEVIYATLGHITQNKTLFTDIYNRDGFIINKGDYYIFNSSDIDVDSSIYSKILDFSIDKTKYTLEQYVQHTFKQPIFDDVQQKEIKRKEKENIELSESDILYNNNIIATSEIFGTYRSRGTVNNIFGPIDNKFRIVEQVTANKRKGKRTQNDQDDDKRKNITGMWVGSYNKGKLIEIAKYLNIQKSLDKYDKKELGEFIETKLKEMNLVLR